MAYPAVSIVMPVYNAERFLLDAIASVEAQTFSDWQLIIIDDKSTDGSRAIIDQAKKNNAKIKSVYLSKNSGVATARNKGIMLSSKAQFLAFLDADDIWMPTRLEKQIVLAGSATTSPLFYTGYEFVDAQAIKSGVVVRVPETMSLTQAYGNHLIWTSTVLVNLKLIDLNDLYMLEIGFGEDITTWWRLLSKYGEAHGVNQPLALYRRGSQSLSSNKVKVLYKKWRVFTYATELNKAQKTFYYMSSLYNAAKKRV